jgi:hypothetical protein
MAIPSGSGTEVLCRGSFETQSNTASAHIWTSPYRATVGTNTATVPANTIITMKSIIACETAGASAGETLMIYAHDGTGEIFLCNAVIPTNGTFVFNDVFVLYPGDKLTMQLSNAGNVDILTTFIKQDWS